MDIRYDTEADALMVWFRDPVAHLQARILDDLRFVHEDDEGVARVEFIEVSGGSNLSGVPHAEEIREALGCLAAPAA
ncbi:MAG: hypothetical protein AB7I38_06420 [Dehalococcoidia bacterium]